MATGALQPGNRMDIATLLSPANESNTMDESTDREIYEAVMVAREAHENMEINGGDDVDKEPVEPTLSRKDVLKATSVIRRFVDDMNDPIAHQLETLLGSFNHQLRVEEMRSLRDSSITDYFTRT